MISVLLESTDVNLISNNLGATNISQNIISKKFQTRKFHFQFASNMFISELGFELVNLA